MTHARIGFLTLLATAASIAGGLPPAHLAKPSDATHAAPALARAQAATQPDSVCRESPRAWHRAAGDTLWLYILMDRATQRVDTQAVVIAGDSAVQLRPRPRRLGPTQAGRLRTMRDRCAAQLRDSTGR